MAGRKKYMETLKEPKDDIDRAYNKYKCEIFTLGSRGLIAIRNIAGFFLFWGYMLKPSRKVSMEKKYQVVIINGDKNKEDSVPDEYKQDYIHEPVDGTRSTQKGDKKFVLKIWRRHPFKIFYDLQFPLKD